MKIFLRRRKKSLFIHNRLTFLLWVGSKQEIKINFPFQKKNWNEGFKEEDQDSCNKCLQTKENSFFHLQEQLIVSTQVNYS